MIFVDWGQINPGKLCIFDINEIIVKYLPAKHSIPCQRYYHRCNVINVIQSEDETVKKNNLWSTFFLVCVKVVMGEIKYKF